MEHNIQKSAAERARQIQETEEIRQRQWVGRAAKLFCAVVVLIGGYFLLTKALPLFFPFLLALALSVPVRHGAVRMERRFGLPRRVGAIVLVILILLLLVVAAVLLGERLIFEAQRLLTTLGEQGDAVTGQIEQTIDFFTRITSHIPPLADLKEQQSLQSFWQQVDATVAALVSDTLTRWSGKIPDAVGMLVRALPSALIFSVTFLIAVFYFCADDGSIRAFLGSLIPPLWRGKAGQLRERLTDVGGRYLRAYFLLFLLTFIQLFVGFSVLGLSYTFLPALIIALVDILPVLGVGMVLVPWGVIALVQGDTFVGTGLLILCAVMLLLRQILEPKIIGGSLGLHPLATLIAVYIGLRVAGILGMIAAPAVALLVKSLMSKDGARAETV